MASTSNNADVAQSNLPYQIAPRLRQANTIAFLGQALSQAGNAIVQETTNNLKSLAHILGNIRDGRISSENLSQIIVDINTNLEQGLGNSAGVGTQVTNVNMLPANIQTSNNYISTSALPEPNSHIAIPNRSQSVKFTILRFNCTEVGCSEVFERMNELEHHLKTNHRINSFRCFQANCGKSFGANKQLEDHRKKDHRNCRIWHCKQCNRKFENNHRSPDRFKGLHDHFIKNHYLGVFSCANCGQTFDCQAKAIKHYDQSACLASQTNRPSTSAADPADPYIFAPQSPIHINIQPRVFQQINNQGMAQSFRQAETFPHQNEANPQPTAEPVHSGRINASNQTRISRSVANQKEDSKHHLRKQ